MAVKRRIAEIWARRPLLQRILLVQGGLLFGGALVFVLLLMVEHRAESIADQQDRSRLLLLITTPLIAEQAVTGDLAAARQLLERQATAYTDVSRLVWRAPGREDIGAVTSQAEAPAPAWFRRLIEIPAVTHSTEISLGGVHYGELNVTLSPQRVEHELWIDFLRYVWLSLGAAGLLFGALFLLLRAPLRALRNLGDSAERFGQGDYATRVRPEGTRETRGAAQAFNSMAERMEQMVTQLLDGRRQLREQLHFTEALIEALPVPMYYKDAMGCYLSVNKAWEEFFDVPREAIIGRTVRDLYQHDPETAAAHEELDARMLAEPTAKTYERSIRLGSGDEREVMYAKATLSGGDGAVIGLIGIITDLTELKHAERQARDALLQKASAEQASAAKSMFLANMSHEIRTPLTAIIGFSEALLDVSQTMAERIEGIRTINRAGKHLLGIINDILDLSKIEAGKLDVEAMPVPVLPLVEEVAALARLQAEAKGLHFRLEPEYPLPWTIQSDPTRIKQILLNLVGNAIKFTERGGVTLRVRHDIAKALLVVEIEDTGIGISPEQIARLFQPFSQADATTTRRFGGTGLGLVLSKQLAERLGGTIVAASVAGAGSRFFVTFATGSVGTLVHSAEEAHASLRVAASDEDTARLAGTVLLAEDNPDNQRLIALNVRRLGATLDVVDDGRKAVAAALARSYELVLMDMQMPVMDGLTAVRTLRDGGYAGPIVALTANATPQDVAACIEAGCDDFLSKPIERSRFGEVLRRYLPVAASAPGTEVEFGVPPILDRDPGLAELMQHFGRKLAGDVVLLRHLAGQSDLAEIGRMAREMRSAAVRYHCDALGELAGQLEFAASAGNAAAAEALIGQIGQVAASIGPRDAAATDAETAPIVSELLAEGPEMQELVTYFLGRLPGYLESLRAAVGAADLAAVKKQAHDLKAVGGGYGYPQVTELAVRIEAAAAADRCADVAALVDAFAALAARIEAGVQDAAPAS